MLRAAKACAPHCPWFTRASRCNCTGRTRRARQSVPQRRLLRGRSFGHLPRRRPSRSPAGLPPWKQAWEHGRPSAVACVERDLENLLSFFTAPESHWQKVRTTNVIERAFREVRRRTRPWPGSATWALEPYAQYFRAVKNLPLRETKSHEADKSSGGYDANP